MNIIHSFIPHLISLYTSLLLAPPPPQPSHHCALRQHRWSGGGRGRGRRRVAGKGGMARRERKREGEGGRAGGKRQGGRQWEGGIGIERGRVKRGVYRENEGGGVWVIWEKWCVERNHDNLFTYFGCVERRDISKEFCWSVALAVLVSLFKKPH